MTEETNKFEFLWRLMMSQMVEQYEDQSNSLKDRKLGGLIAQEMYKAEMQYDAGDR